MELTNNITSFQYCEQVSKSSGGNSLENYYCRIESEKISKLKKYNRKT